MSFTQKLDGLVEKYNELEKKLLDPNALGSNYAKISREHSELIPIVALIHEYQRTQKELKDLSKPFPLQLTEK